MKNVLENAFFRFMRAATWLESLYFYQKGFWGSRIFKSVHGCLCKHAHGWKRWTRSNHENFDPIKIGTNLNFLKDSLMKCFSAAFRIIFTMKASISHRSVLSFLFSYEYHTVHAYLSKLRTRAPDKNEIWVLIQLY